MVNRTLGTCETTPEGITFCFIRYPGVKKKDFGAEKFLKKYWLKLPKFNERHKP